MNCNKIHKILPEYAEGKLNEKHSEEVCAHLNQCVKCKDIYKQLLTTLDQLKPKADIPEHPFYYTRLKQRMENSKTIPSMPFISFNFKKIMQPVIYMTTIILAVYVGILIGSGSSGLTQYSEVESRKEFIEDFADLIFRYSQF